ncbi:RmlC-like cupin family protein, partial [Reticulomyxa filosa]
GNGNGNGNDNGGSGGAGSDDVSSGAKKKPAATTGKTKRKVTGTRVRELQKKFETFNESEFQDEDSSDENEFNFFAALDERNVIRKKPTSIKQISAGKSPMAGGSGDPHKAFTLDSNALGAVENRPGSRKPSTSRNEPYKQSLLEMPAASGTTATITTTTTTTTTTATAAAAASVSTTPGAATGASANADSEHEKNKTATSAETAVTNANNNGNNGNNNNAANGGNDPNNTALDSKNPNSIAVGQSDQHGHVGNALGEETKDATDETVKTSDISPRNSNLMCTSFCTCSYALTYLFV